MMNDFVRYIRKHKLTLADDVVITCDNLKMLGEFIGVSAISKVMHFQGDRGYRLYAGLVHDILYEKQENETFSDGYDIASEAICFLCDHIGKPLGTILGVISKGRGKGRVLTIRDMCFKTVFAYIYRNQKYESNIADLNQPNLREMSVPFECELEVQKSSNISAIMRKIGLTEKEKYTLRVIMSGMNPYKVSKHLGMSNHGIYNRVYRMRQKYIKFFGLPLACNVSNNQI